MRMTGEAKVQRKHGQIRFTVGESFQGVPQSQTILMSMEANPHLAAKDSRKMKRGAKDRARDVGEA